MNKDFYAAALKVLGITDEEVSEQYRTFSKELINTPDIYLWLTWHEYLNNLKTNKEIDIAPNGAEQDLLEQFDWLRVIIPSQYWYEMNVSCNNSASFTYDEN